MDDARHAERSRSFGSVAQRYDEFRPAPPLGALDLLGSPAGREVLELGAGTGKLTRFLLGYGARVTALEPDDAMSAVLRRQSPEVTHHAAGADAIPVESDSFDVVACQSAWHWFPQPATTREVARVLRDGGQLWILGIGMDGEHPWLDELVALRDANQGVARPDRNWAFHVVRDGPFDHVSDEVLPWRWPRTIDQLIGLFGTYSATIVRPREEQWALEDELRERLERLFPDDHVEVPMTFRASIFTRRAR